jgi:DNA helicase II / ATP-dependent DNA helicase PcrA
MEYTNEQKEIYNGIANTDNHIFINAGAGTGKTTTIVEASGQLPYGTKAAFLAFNKSIADELATKLPEGVVAKTFHAFGFAAIRAAGVKTKVNNYKLNNIIKDLLGADFYAAPLKKLVSLIKGSLVAGNDIKSINILIDEYNINFNSEREELIAIEAIPAILTMCRTQTHIIDFDDMIWMPLVNEYPFPKYDVLFVDEAQDFNESQREMISKCVNGGRCIIVGDKNQAIYGFRGADSNSIGLFRERLMKGEREISDFPLSISWRCPKSVVREANRYVKEFSAPDFAKEGNVIVNAGFHPHPHDMVLCRYNAPLVGAFYDLISQGKSAYILGRDMTKGLITAVQKVSKNNNMGTDEFWDLFMQDFTYNHQRLINDNKKNQAMGLEDKKDCISIFVNKATTVGGIIEEIKRVFDGNDKGDIMLSTVHKAKGLEADNVYILATERMPHPLGGQEENNIAYVAITRAKNNLFYCGPKPQIN